jgi:hypothetical protein
MIDQQRLFQSEGIEKLTAELKKFLNETRSKLKSCERRKFMAKVVLFMGRGGQIRAERELASIIFADAGGIASRKNCRIFLMISSKLSSR